MKTRDKLLEKFLAKNSPGFEHIFIPHLHLNFALVIFTLKPDLHNAESERTYRLKYTKDTYIENTDMGADYSIESKYTDLRLQIRVLPYAYLTVVLKR